MKAITLYQPWASLIAMGAKRIESRSWYTGYRGPLAIHAGKKNDYINPDKIRYICHDEPFRKVLGITGMFDYTKKFPLGCIVATCELIACLKVESIGEQPDIQGWKFGTHYFPASKQEFYFGDYSIGRYRWFLANIKPLENPIPTTGSMGFWEWHENQR